MDITSVIGLLTKCTQFWAGFHYLLQKVLIYRTILTDVLYVQQAYFKNLDFFVDFWWAFFHKLDRSFVGCYVIVLLLLKDLSFHVLFILISIFREDEALMWISSLNTPCFNLKWKAENGVILSNSLWKNKINNNILYSF